MSRLSVSPVRKPSVDIVKLTDAMLHLSAYNALYFNTLRLKLTDDRRFAKKDFAYNRTPYDRKLVTVKALISNSRHVKNKTTMFLEKRETHTCF